MKTGVRLCVTFIFFWFTSFSALAADFRDTLYYDRGWRICVRPMATYYRACTLNKTGKIYFVGAFRDYTIDHKLLATGSYDGSGRRQGLFTYYYVNGKTRKLGHFVDDEMKGPWYFYKPQGTLYYINNHYNNHEAAPLFIVQDTELVLKDGSGNFSIFTGDFPDVFNGQQLVIAGSSANNLKSGTWTYFVTNYSQALMPGRQVTSSEYILGEHRISNTNFMGAVDREDRTIRGRNFNSLIPDYPTPARSNLPRKMAKEVYENGVFKKGSGRAMAPNEPFTGLRYVPQETLDLEMLRPHPGIFGMQDVDANRQRFIHFLVSGTVPAIPVQSTAYNNNLQVLAPLFGGALTGIMGVLGNPAPENLQTEVPVYAWQLEDWPSFHCRFYIQADGTLSHISITGPVPEPAKERLLFFLSKIKGLVPPADPSYTDIYFYSGQKRGQKKGKGNIHQYYISYYDHSLSQ